MAQGQRHGALGPVGGIVVLGAITFSFLVTPILTWRWSQLPFLGMMMDPSLVLNPL